MRIRKNARLSPLMYAATSSSSLKPTETLSVQSTYLNCQLNQSPWDVLTFPTEEDPALETHPFFASQFINGYTDNGSFYNSNGTVESVTSMKLDKETEMKEPINCSKWDYNNIAEVPGGDFIKYESTPVDKKQDRDEAVEMELELGLDKNNSITTILCDHQLTDPAKHNKLQHEDSSRGRRPRAKKSLSSTSSNPYEFYYYSGFGPMWGKKRGPHAKNVESNITPYCSSSSQLDEYVEDEFEDEAEENGKKRARKPIKARSLKSLM